MKMQSMLMLTDDHITHSLLRRNGCGTKGHLRIPEESEMAVELSTYIESRNVDGWEAWEQ